MLAFYVLFICGKNDSNIMMYKSAKEISLGGLPSVTKRSSIPDTHTHPQDMVTTTDFRLPEVQTSDWRSKEQRRCHELEYPTDSNHLFWLQRGGYMCLEVYHGSALLPEERLTAFGGVGSVGSTAS